MFKPIFIGCCGSSGSTLLGILLNRHPEIACGPEINFFNKKKIYNIEFRSFKSKFNYWSKNGINSNGYWLSLGFLLNRNYYGLSDDNIKTFLNESNTLREFTDFIIDAFLKKYKKKRFAEKTPTNVYCFKEIVNLYPGAKILHVVRDGRDVFCSLKKRPNI